MTIKVQLNLLSIPHLVALSRDWKHCGRVHRAFKDHFDTGELMPLTAEPMNTLRCIGSASTSQLILRISGIRPLRSSI